MTLLTDTDRARLTANGQRRSDTQRANPDADLDPCPVVKLFTPDAGCTWLLTEIDPTDPDLAFGLCDLGMGCPELGYVSLAELAAVRGRLGLPVERDLHFVARYPISVYATHARRCGGISA